MDWSSEQVLSVLDRCCRWLDFPMLNNGYIYLAATRLSLYRSDNDWALVEEWNHPDLAGRELPNSSESFQQLAKVLYTGNTNYYNPTEPPNTDWRNWLDGGTL